MPEPTEPHLRQSDAFTRWMEADPLLRSTIVAVALLDRAPDFAVLRDRLERATRLAPGFREKLVEAPFKLATPRWVTDPDFDLSFHLRRVQAPPPATLETVMELARQTGMAGFDTARPLWEATLVEGLDGGKAALVLKVHHALTDGIGGMDLALYLFDLERDAAAPTDTPAAPAGQTLGSLELLRDAVTHNAAVLGKLASSAARAAIPAATNAVRNPRATVDSLFATLGSVGRFVAPVSQTKSPIMTDRKLLWDYRALDVPAAALKEAAKAAGGTMNDGFLAGVTGGLRRYHEHHRAGVEDLRVTMPISLRKDGDPIGGNRITIMRFPVPVGIADPAERVQALHRIALDIRNEPAIEHSNTIAAVLNLLPRSVIGGMLKHIDFLASNVPGFRVPVYLVGAEVQRFYALGPTIGASANLTLLSYRDVAGVGVTTDAGAVPDPEVFLSCIADGFDEVLDLAGEHEPVRIAAL